MADLKMFYAVTTDGEGISVYRAECKEKFPHPFVQKIGIRGHSNIPLSALMPSGHFVGITKFGLVIYGSADRKIPSDYSSGKYTKTSPVVALFLNEKQAFDCWDSGHLKTPDLRWRKQTGEVLEAIGPDHPMFILSEEDPIKYK